MDIFFFSSLDETDVVNETLFYLGYRPLAYWPPSPMSNNGIVQVRTRHAQDSANGSSFFDLSEGAVLACDVICKGSLVEEILHRFEMCVSNVWFHFAFFV